MQLNCTKLLGLSRQADMDGIIVKEEPLDLDDQGEDGDGMYSESEDEGIRKI